MPIYRVVVLTPSHSIDGEIFLTEKRLSDHLNVRNETVIVLRNASIARLNEPNKILERNAQAAVPKDWIVVAFEPQQEAVPVASRLYAYVRKQTLEVFLAMDGMEVRGFYHTTTELVIHKLLATPPDPFFPLTKPVITLYANERLVLKPDAILVNVRRIRYMAKLETKPESKADASTSATTNPSAPTADSAKPNGS